MVQTWNVGVRTSAAVASDGRRRVRRRQGKRRVCLPRTSTCRRPTAAATASRPYFATFGRQNAIRSWGQHLRTQLQLTAAGVQPLVQPRVHVQGRVYAQQVDERVRRRRPHRVMPSTNIRSSSRPQLGSGRIRSHAQPAVGLRVSLPWQSDGSGYEDVIGKAIISDWQVNGVVAAFSGTPVYGHGRRDQPEYARHHADRESRFRLQRAREHRRLGQVVRYRRFHPADRRDHRQHGTQSVPWAWRVERRLRDVPYVPVGRTAADSSSGSRRTTSSTTRCSRILRAASPAPRSDRSPASAAAVPIRSASCSSGFDSSSKKPSVSVQVARPGGDRILTGPFFQDRQRARSDMLTRMRARPAHLAWISLAVVLAAHAARIGQGAPATAADCSR